MEADVSEDSAVVDQFYHGLLKFETDAASLSGNGHSSMEHTPVSAGMQNERHPHHPSRCVFFLVGEALRQIAGPAHTNDVMRVLAKLFRLRRRCYYNVAYTALRKAKYILRVQEDQAVGRNMFRYQISEPRFTVWCKKNRCHSVESCTESAKRHYTLAEQRRSAANGDVVHLEDEEEYVSSGEDDAATFPTTSADLTTVLRQSFEAIANSDNHNHHQQHSDPIRENVATLLDKLAKSQLENTQLKERIRQMEQQLRRVAEIPVHDMTVSPTTGFLEVRMSGASPIRGFVAVTPSSRVAMSAVDGSLAAKLLDNRAKWRLHSQSDDGRQLKLAVETEHVDLDQLLNVQ